MPNAAPTSVSVGLNPPVTGFHVRPPVLEVPTTALVPFEPSWVEAAKYMRPPPSNATEGSLPPLGTATVSGSPRRFQVRPLVGLTNTPCRLVPEIRQFLCGTYTFPDASTWTWP